MGKMPGTSGDRCGGGSGLRFESGLEAAQLRLRKSMKKGLKEDDRLAQAGIEIVVDGVQKLPIAIRLKGLTGGELFHRGLEAVIQLLDKIGEGRDLVKELRFTREEDFAEEVIEPSDALALGILKVFRGERDEIRSSAKVLGVFEHGTEYGTQRVGQSFTKSRSNGENLISLGTAATAAHAEGFIQAYTEHGVGGLKTPDAVQISMRFIAPERKSPILRH